MYSIDNMKQYNSQNTINISIENIINIKITLYKKVLYLRGMNRCPGKYLPLFSLAAALKGKTLLPLKANSVL